MPAVPSKTLKAQPPILKVKSRKATQQFPLLTGSIRLGRNDDNDIVIHQAQVSSHHAQLIRQGADYKIIDLNSKLGLIHDGKQIRERNLQHGDVLYIGIDLSLTYLNPTAVVKKHAPLELRGKTLVYLGRDPGNHVVLDHPLVSRRHAQLQLRSGTWVIQDLKSSNGTYVNGQPINSPHDLRVGEVIRIGPYALQLNLEETLGIEDEAGQLRLDAVDLCKVVSGGKTLLDHISLSILPREFVVIAGVSGGGKSTLLDALNGFRPATSGEVLVNGRNLYQNFEAYRSDLGYVPQKDIIHMELSVEQALDFAAQLRMPADVSLAERKHRVFEVMEELGLTKRREVAVKALSGGQLKRVSIGVELLTKPSLFFLDEATSGLDPGTEADVMQLLRNLADGERTILLITHATENIKLCDLVIFLAAGGRVAYFGPPSQAPKYFGVASFNEIYPKVERDRTPEEWQSRYRKSAIYQDYVAYRQGDLKAIKAVAKANRAAPKSRKSSISAWQQWVILTRRNFAVLLRDRISLMLMLLIAPVLGLLDFITWKHDLFDSKSGNAEQVITMLFTTALIAVMVGSLTTMREIAKEQEIYRRERMIGLQILPYILSKIGISLILASYQSGIFLIFKILAIGFPDQMNLGGLYITLLLTSFAGMVMGLLVSAIAPNQTIAPLLIILFLIPQVTFGGGLIPHNRLNIWGQTINQFTLTKWSFEALVTTTSLGNDVAKDSCWRSDPTPSSTQKCNCKGSELFNICQFPGIRKSYNPEVNQSEPVQPQQPIDPRNLEIYQSQLKDWKDQYIHWTSRRQTAITEAEKLIERVNIDYGAAFAVSLKDHWKRLVQLIIGMFSLIWVAQKQKA